MAVSSITTALSHLLPSVSFDSLFIYENTLDNYYSGGSAIVDSDAEKTNWQRYDYPKELFQVVHVLNWEFTTLVLRIHTPLQISRLPS